MEETKVSSINHEIDPRQKNKSWILNAVKIYWDDSKRYLPIDTMFHGRDKLRKIKQFAMGMNSVDEYKRKPLGEKQTDETWLNQDYSIRSTLQLYRDKIISKILQRDFNITARVVDPLAKSQREEFYNKLKIKIIARQEAAKQDPELLNMPALQLLPGEPKDLEELEMYMEYGYKNHTAMEGEMIVDYVFRRNKVNQLRKEIATSLVDFGFGGYKDDLSHKGEVITRAVDLERFLVSYCEKADFSDAVCWGEVVDVSFADLSRYFSVSDLEVIKRACAGKWGNPDYNDSRWANETRKFKAQVWDVVFESWNDSAYEESEDNYGNMRVSKTGLNIDTELAEKKGKTIYRDTQKVYFKAKWIIGTDFMYDYGITYGTKRKYGREWDATSPYHLFAWNFDKMNFQGMVERLMPIQNEIQNTLMKIQNFKNKWIPYIIKLDIGALEKTGFGSGAKGKAMSPMQLLDFLFENHILVLRDGSLGTANNSYKAVEILTNGMANEFKVLFDDLIRLQTEMQEKAGFNDVTQGGNVNAKMLTSGYNAALMGTNDSLWHLIDADRRLLESLAAGVVQRVQAAVNLGHGDMYEAALGEDSVKMLKISDEFPLRDIGIFFEDKPTDDDVRLLFEKMNMKEQQGLLEPADMIMIKTCSNFRQMESLMAARVKMRKEQQRQFEMAKIKEASNGNMEAGVALEEAKRKTIAFQHELAMQELQVKGQFDIVVKQIGVEGQHVDNEIQAKAKVISQQIIASVKKETAKV